MFSALKSHKEKFILISNCESYVGYALAYHLATELRLRPGKMKKKWRVRALCENIQGKEALVQAGVDVQQVQYQDQMILRSQMKGVRSIIITCMGLSSETQVPYTMNVMSAASTEKVKRVQMISMLGCQYSEDENSPMGRYYALEQHLRETFAYGRWCIFRLAFLNQGFYFWNEMIEHSGKIGMPMSPDTEFTTLSIQDVCDAVATLVLTSHKGQVESNNEDDDEDDDDEDTDEIEDPSVIKRIYELTGQCPYTGRAAAMKLNKALGGEEGEIQFAEISEDELREYLERQSAKPNHADPPGLVPDPHRYINEAFIDALIDWFKILKRVNFGQTMTHHVRDLTGKEPMDLGQFFIENRREFRRPSDSQ
ncbi:hypothetical protein BDC45DRAFT_564209 [Circinella umbellata]|nr:hypothetical protein BDC45DRAFT_564209 [Circinella umbellata]